MPRREPTGLQAYDRRRILRRMARFRLPADDLEYAVLAEIWRLGSASVRELHQRLGVPQNLVYTTTAKVVDRLREKGLIQRERQGQAFIYRARADADEVERARARSAVARLFGAAPRAAVAALVEAVDALNPALLEEIERAVAARRRSKRGT